MKPRIPAEAFAVTFVDELVRNGITDAVAAPGSRSAPLALALAEHPGIRLRVSLDERSASFLALGIAKATRRAVAVLCTSGTAAANLYPAVQEAHQWRVPLLVLTADRPPELRDTGANQTLDQIKMYGDAVRWFCEVGVPDGQLGADPNGYWRSIACRAVATAQASPAGPVHLNAAFREPLVASDHAPIDENLEGRANGAPWLAVTRPQATLADDDLKRLAVRLSGYERGVLVAGAGDFDATAFEALAASLGWPLLADPLSNVRTSDGCITAYDSLLRVEPWVEAHRPDIVVRAGALGISKSLAAFVASAPHQILVDGDGTFVDPQRRTTDLIHADPDLLFAQLARRIERASGDWPQGWLVAEQTAVGAIAATLETYGLCEPRVARDLVAALPAGSNLVVGASMPFRDVEWFAPPSGVRFHGNRGANGIDGFVSTTLGIALGSQQPTFGLCGDLTLLHDSNGFLLQDYDGPPVTFVVVNNDGGGIFSFLPQAGLPEHFETLFGTPHGRDIADLARFHDLVYRRANSPEELASALGEPDGGIRLLEIRTDRAANVDIHRTLNDAVASALS